MTELSRVLVDNDARAMRFALDDDLALERELFDVESPTFDPIDAAAILPRVEGRDVTAEDRAAVHTAIATLAMRAQRYADQAHVRIVPAILTVLWKDEGFRGDEHDYDAPERSYVQDTLLSNRGLPITLSMVTQWTAEACGVRVIPLALPGHFMTALVDPGTGEHAERVTIVDTFHQSLIRASELSRRFGMSVPEVFESAVPSHKDVLLRMLNNLRQGFQRRGRVIGCIAAISRMLILQPHQPRLRLERARQLADAGMIEEARTDLERIADKVSDDEDLRLEVALIRADLNRKRALVH